ncbi:MAG: hypothetical protein HC881_16340 [Leptolyngbyaceae cyanobacterium SL_7_1]|nr:hypothetical protein [Leptolyngbyaceae cyanobacterium SL_7_1]
MEKNAVIVLVEALERRSFSAVHALKAAIEIAKILGLEIYPIPYHDSEAQILLPVSRQPYPRTGIWLGDTALPDRYDRLYELALHNQIHLVNTPAQHGLIQHFDRVYPQLSDLMPKSVVVSQLDRWAIAFEQLGFPVIAHCIQPIAGVPEWAIATNWQEMQRLIELFKVQHPHPQVLLQHLQPRHTRSTAHGFPLGRHYQIVFYQQTPMTYGYRWAGDDSLIFLDTDEEAAMMEVAVEAATRLQVPLVAIEVVQQECNQWLVVGVGDLHWSTLGQMPLIQLWNELSKISLG